MNADDRSDLRAAEARPQGQARGLPGGCKGGRGAGRSSAPGPSPHLRTSAPKRPLRCLPFSPVSQPPPGARPCGHRGVPQHGEAAGVGVTGATAPDGRRFKAPPRFGGAPCGPRLSTCLRLSLPGPHLACPALPTPNARPSPQPSNYAVPDPAYWAGEQCPPDPKRAPAPRAARRLHAPALLWAQLASPPRRPCVQPCCRALRHYAGPPPPRPLLQALAGPTPSRARCLKPTRSRSSSSPGEISPGVFRRGARRLLGPPAASAASPRAAASPHGPLPHPQGPHRRHPPPSQPPSSCNAMNEVWVPSEWQKETFVASGVEASKIRVVPEVRPRARRARAAGCCCCWLAVHGCHRCASGPRPTWCS
jgi:hypothetical protein